MTRLVTVQFVKDHDAMLIFMNNRFVKVGPFRRFDIATIPEDIAEELIRNGIAVKLQEESGTHTHE